MKLLYVLGIILTIVLGTGVLFLVGTFLQQFIVSQDRYFSLQLGVIFAIPGAIVLLIYLCLLPFIYVPNAYVIDSNDGVEVSKTLYYSLNAMKKQGKGTLLLTYLSEFGFTLLYAGLVALIGVILDQFLVVELAVFICSLLALPYFWLAPYATLTFQVARYCLYEDVVYDQLIAYKKVSGVAIKDVTTKSKPTANQMLNHVFSNESTESLDIAKMSALLNMEKQFAEVKSPIEKDLKEKILSTPVDEFDKLRKAEEPVIEEIIEEVEELVEESVEIEELTEEVVEIEELTEEVVEIEELTEEAVEVEKLVEEAVEVEELTEEAIEVEESTEEVIEVEELTEEPVEVEELTEEPVEIEELTVEAVEVEELTEEAIEVEELIEEPVEIEELTEEAVEVEELIEEPVEIEELIEESTEVEEIELIEEFEELFNDEV